MIFLLFYIPFLDIDPIVFGWDNDEGDKQYSVVYICILMIVFVYVPGDVLGLLLNLEKEEVVFSLNGKPLPPYKQVFEVSLFKTFDLLPNRN